MSTKSLAGLLVIALATLACSPVIAISGNELLIIGILVAALLGPPIYRLLRRLEKFWNRQDK